MTPEQFVYWMQGFAELTNGAHPTPDQWKSINDHLKTVFNKVTPPVNPFPQVQPQLTNPWPNTNPYSGPNSPLGPTILC